MNDSTNNIVLDCKPLTEYKKIIDSCHKCYNIDRDIFVIKFNAMVSDFKLHMWIRLISNNDKTLVKNIHSMITLYKKIYKQQCFNVKNNKEQFGTNYKPPEIYTLEKVESLTGLDQDKIKKIIARVNAFNQKVIKNKGGLNNTI